MQKILHYRAETEVSTGGGTIWLYIAGESEDDSTVRIELGPLGAQQYQSTLSTLLTRNAYYGRIDGRHLVVGQG